MTRVLVMSTHICPDGDTEAEPVLVECDETDVHLLLDDGTRIVLNRAELAAAMQAPAEWRAA